MVCHGPTGADPGGRAIRPRSLRRTILDGFFVVTDYVEEREGAPPYPPAAPLRSWMGDPAERRPARCATAFGSMGSFPSTVARAAVGPGRSGPASRRAPPSARPRLPAHAADPRTPPPCARHRPTARLAPWRRPRPRGLAVSAGRRARARGAVPLDRWGRGLATSSSGEAPPGLRALHLPVHPGRSVRCHHVFRIESSRKRSRDWSPFMEEVPA